MTTRTQMTVGLSALALALALMPTGVTSAAAQQPPQQQQQSTQTLSNQQIEQLVAPIALYPDSLLSQVLMASTYPLEVVEAARWVKENPNVTGQALQDAMLKQPWDPSVKSLAAVPQTLAMMNDQISWTQNLGDAFLAQQSDVFNAVQALRARADAAGNLKSTPQQTVTRVNRPAGSPASAPATAFTIASASPTEYFVPIYDPNVVFGAWPYPAYAPTFWYPPGWGGGWWGFGAGVFAGAAIWGGVNWWNRNVNINVNRYNQFNRTNITNANWRHNPAHRGNVAVSQRQRRQAVRRRQGRAARSRASEPRQQRRRHGRHGRRRHGWHGRRRDGRHGPRRHGPRWHGAWWHGQAAWVKAEWAAWAKAAWVEWAEAWVAAAWVEGGMGGMGGMGGGGMGGWAAWTSRRHGRRRHGRGQRWSAEWDRWRRMAASPHGWRRSRRLGGGGGGGGRRSDITLKHDIALHRPSRQRHRLLSLRLQRQRHRLCRRHGAGRARVRPDAVMRGRDGYLRVFYDKLGVKFQTYEQWLADGALVPSVAQ